VKQPVSEFIVDDLEALAYMRRAISMLRSVEVPYWLGHALQNLGHVLLNLHGEPEEAAGLLSEARVLLQDCGDMHCWAGTSRVLSQAETALGMYHEPALRIVQVIDSLPILPFADTHLPWTLDDCARVLLVAGSYERAAIAFGKALHVPLPGEAFIPRETVQAWTRGPLSERLGDAEMDRLLAEGAAIEIVDGTMTSFGFPVGPITLVDEVGLDVAEKASGVLHRALGARLSPAPGITRLVQAGRLGRKSGRGFYDYSRK